MICRHDIVFSEYRTFYCMQISAFEFSVVAVVIQESLHTFRKLL